MYVQVSSDLCCPCCMVWEISLTTRGRAIFRRVPKKNEWVGPRTLTEKMYIHCFGKRFSRLQLLMFLGLGLVVVFIMKQIHDSQELDGDAIHLFQPEVKSNFVYNSNMKYNNNIADMVHYEKGIPLIWVGGVPRSGTTLARAMLDAHPLIRCGEETRVIPRILGMHSQMLKSELESTRLKEAKITEDVLNDALGAYILSIISKHGEPAPRLCNKDPFTLRSMSRIRQIFPNSKFILMIRDGRATVHSIITRKVTIKGFNIHSYRGALQDWNRAIENMYNQCRDVGEQWCLPVHYEQLVLHPEPQMKRILQFLGVAWNPVVLHHERTIGQAGGVSLSKKELSTDQVDKPVNTAALTKWVGHIPSDVQNDMDLVAPMLRKLGYNPSENPPNYGKADAVVQEQSASMDLASKLEKANLH